MLKNPLQTKFISQLKIGDIFSFSEHGEKYFCTLSYSFKVYYRSERTKQEFKTSNMDNVVILHSEKKKYVNSFKNPLKTELC